MPSFYIIHAQRGEPSLAQAEDAKHALQQYIDGTDPSHGPYIVESLDGERTEFVYGADFLGTVKEFGDFVAERIQKTVDPDPDGGTL